MALRKRVRNRLRRHKANKERKGQDIKACPIICISQTTGGLKQVGELKANNAKSLKEIKESNAEEYDMQPVENLLNKMEKRDMKRKKRKKKRVPDDEASKTKMAISEKQRRR